MKKLLVVGVIILFIGLAFAPSIHANISKEGELVEITTEVCGQSGIKPSTVQLTQNEAEAVDRLFEEIKSKLDNVESREETVQIFNEAIVELDKYGLLGDLSINQVQQLVTSWYQDTKIKRLIDQLFVKYQDTYEGDNNVICLVAGETNHNLFFCGPIPRSIFLLARTMITLPLDLAIILSKLALNLDLIFVGALIILISLAIFIPNALLWSIFLEPSTFYGELTHLSPLHFGSIVGIGYYDDDSNINHSADGWIFSMGLGGKIVWNGSFYGILPLVPLRTLDFYYWDILPKAWYYPGIARYFGIKLESLTKTHFLGCALRVQLGPEPPEDPWD